MRHDYEKKYGGLESLHMAMIEGRVNSLERDRVWSSHANKAFFDWLIANGLDNTVESVMASQGVNKNISSFILYCLSQSKPMRFGMTLPSFVTDGERINWAKASFASLDKTNTDGLESKPLLQIIAKGKQSLGIASSVKLSQFEVEIIEQPEEIKSNDGCLVWGWDRLAKTPGITHLGFLTDDWLYNRNWILELRNLVLRKPGATAWWVYRSTYEEIHKTLREEEGAVLVKSINAGGCVTVQEHREWKMDWRKCPRENVEEGRLSLDLLHPQQRPGDRWVTPKSYILNIGLRGACQRPDTNDFAREFVGFE